MRQSNIVMNNQRPRRALFGSNRTKLIINFSLVFVIIFIIVEWIGIMGVPFTPHSGRRREQKAEAFRSLNLVADLKKERLLRWIKERRDDAHVYADNDLIEDNVAQLRAIIREFTAEGREDAEVWTLVRAKKSYRNLVRYLDNIKSTHGIYNKIQIAEAEIGIIFVSTDDVDLGADGFQYSCFTGVLQSGDDCVGDIQLIDQSRNPIFHISHVIDNKEGAVVAVLMMEVNTDNIIKPMLHTGEGLGEKGEALLVNQDMKILTSLKHPLADGSRAKPLEYQITSKPAVLAANGKEGIIESEDYRGEPVLAVYRHIKVTPEWSWGMVVKRDKAELFAPLRRDIKYTLFIGLVGILAVVVLTIFIGNNLTRPILSLSQISNQVAEGNLAARALVTTSDEVGALAKTFNSMVQNIQRWRGELEERVQVSTAELRLLNDDLMKEIAERKQAEEAREALLEELEAKNAELERFTYTVSHDLKSPLITIKGFLGLLEQDAVAGDMDKMKSDATRISDAVDKMQQLLQELLELSRIGRLMNPPEEVSLDELVRDAVNMVAGRLAERGVKVEIAPNLPVVYGDHTRLREVLENLVDNAVKFMGDQSEPCVEIGARRDGEETVFYVRDNGIGIEPEYHEKVFELFDKLEPQTEGTGVGLAIVKRIVEVHGGRIWVESEGTGQGSTFCFTLPDKSLSEK